MYSKACIMLVDAMVIALTKESLEWKWDKHVDKEKAMQQMFHFSCVKR